MSTASIRPNACPICLRRTQLLARLAPYMERARLAGGAPAADLLCLENENLAASVAPDAACRLITEVEALSERRLQDDLEGAGCWAVCRHDPLYPAGLRDLPNPPWALIGRGEPRLLAELALPANAVALVGARRATSYGREVARSLGRDLAAAGLTVISGMAFGVDACAHRGALDEGRTVAVLGCGPDVAYPALGQGRYRHRRGLRGRASQAGPALYSRMGGTSRRRA